LYSYSTEEDVSFKKKMSLEEKDVVFQQIIAHVIADRGKEHGTEQRSKIPTEGFHYEKRPLSQTMSQRELLVI
jgi:hypothetical protein